jgi:hypothetical protein
MNTVSVWRSIGVPGIMILAAVGAAAGALDTPSRLRSFSPGVPFRIINDSPDRRPLTGRAPMEQTNDPT